MKFASIVAIALAAVPTVFGGVIAERNQLEPRLFSSGIVNSIKKVNAGVQALDMQVVKIKSPDLTKFLALSTASQTLSDTLTSQTKTVNAQANADLIGSFAIQLAVTDLINSVKKLSKDLIAIKPYADQAQVSSVVLNQVQMQMTSSGAYSDAIASKVPSILAFISNYDKQQVMAALQAVIDAYSAS